MYHINAPSDIWANFPCFTCMVTSHSCKIGLRYPVVVSSIILNNWQGRHLSNNYPGDDIHVDYLTIPGETVRELHHAFKAKYKNVHCPVDVILVRGLNEIVRGATDTEIMKDIWDFNATMRKMCFCSSEKYRSRFAAATLPFPPRLTVLLKDMRKIMKNRRDTLVKP